jgi:hypothetical protein
MKRKTKLTASLVLAAFTGGMTGCAMDQHWLPERPASVQEAFPNLTPPPDTSVAEQAVVQQFFNAPFEDVFQAVNQSAAQAMLQIQHQDKRSGLILATEPVRRQPSDRVFTSFYYAIQVKEQGPRRSAVTVMAKVQYPCHYQDSGAGWHIATLGMATALEAGGKQTCERLTAVRWAASLPSDKAVTLPFAPNRGPEIARFFSFVRNNLLAAGAI